MKQLLSGPEIYFRIARICLLMLIIVLPMAYITALREVFFMLFGVSLTLNLIFDPNRRLSLTPLWLPWLIYIVICLLSIYTAVDWQYSLKEFKSEVLKGLLLYYGGAHFIQNRNNIKQAWLTILGGACLMGLLGLILFFVYQPNPSEEFIRAGSLHYGYGAFGTYLITIWPFVLLSPWSFANKSHRWLCVLLIALVGIMGYLTFSRAVWLAMLAVGALSIILMGRRRLRRAIWGSFLCLAVLIALWFAPGSTHGEKWHLLWKNPMAVGGTAGDLLTLWRFSLEEIKKNPFTGIGLGRHSFSKAFKDFREKHQPLLWHTHNMFLDIALQLGLQGLAIILFMIVSIVFLMIPRAPPAYGDIEAYFCTATAIMVIGFAIRNFFDNFFVDDSSMMLWLLTGMAMGARELTLRNLSRTK